MNNSVKGVELSFKQNHHVYLSRFIIPLILLRTIGRKLLIFINLFFFDILYSKFYSYFFLEVNKHNDIFSDLLISLKLNRFRIPLIYNVFFCEITTSKTRLNLILWKFDTKSRLHQFWIVNSLEFRIWK